jgi:hypothetical protein
MVQARGLRAVHVGPVCRHARSVAAAERDQLLVNQTAREGHARVRPVRELLVELQEIVDKLSSARGVHLG